MQHTYRSSKLNILFVLMLSPAAFAAESPSAAQVMESVDKRYDGDSAVIDYTMILIDRRDRQRSRTLRMYSRDDGPDTRTLSLFDSPADIRGTAYLHYDWNDANRDDDSWLYLPSLQRVKRIASSDTSDSFLGSDFTYADINGLEFSWYNYTFISESEMVDGYDCWVIEATPKPEFKEKAESATGYEKSQVWIRKDNLVQVRGQIWELSANRIKYFTASEVEEIDGVWTTRRLQVISTRNGKQEHASVLQVTAVNYNVELSDDMFTTEYMQRGLD